MGGVINKDNMEELIEYAGFFDISKYSNNVIIQIATIVSVENACIDNIVYAREKFYGEPFCQKE